MINKNEIETLENEELGNSVKWNENIGKWKMKWKQWMIEAVSNMNKWKLKNGCKGILKNEINLKTNSIISEVKSYEKY